MAQYFPPYGWSQEGKKRISLPSLYKGSLLLPRPTSSAPPFLDFGASYPSSSSVTGRSATAARALKKIHSEAERRRRERINAHLSTLRRMIPDADKMDKASLLGSVIEQVKDLKRKASATGKGFQVPTEVNEVTVECKQGNGHLYIIRASICCEDRPDLFTDLIPAFHGLSLRTIRADMTSLGGRVKNVFILYRKEGNAGMCLSSLKQSIEEALSRVVSPDMVSTNVFPSKRAKAPGITLLLLGYYIQEIFLLVLLPSFNCRPSNPRPNYRPSPYHVANLSPRLLSSMAELNQ